MTKEPFGSRLRRERERRQIALSSISANSKISVALFEALEREDVSRWPAGIFRRAFIRAYATGIGLDPDPVVREFLERFPDPTEPQPTAATDLPAASAASEAAELARATGLRLTLAETGTAFRKGRVLGNMRQRWAAVACDAAVVIALAAAVFAVFGQFWLPLGVSALGYYWGGIVLLGNTPGVCLWAPATGRGSSRPAAIDTRAKVMKAKAAILARFKRAASAPDRPQTLRSEPRASRS